MKALALVDGPGHVCCRYRLRAFEPALAEAGGTLRVEALAGGPLSRLAQFARADQYDAVILQRKLLPGWQLRALRRRAKRLVFDYDDAVLYRDSNDRRGPHCRRRAGRFAATVGLADAVIAGNGFLADCAVEVGAEPGRVRVIPTCVEPGRYAPSAHEADRGGMDLVWIGSSSTLLGLERARSLWERLGGEVPGLTLRLIADRSTRFDPLPVVAVPWSEATEAAELARGDVGVAWVPDDLWSRGKCGLKVLQYQAAGLPVIANPVGVHREMIQPGVSGYLTESAEEWVEAAWALAVDLDLRRRMGREARTAVERAYSVAAWAPAFVAAVTGRAAPLAPKSAGRAARAGAAA